MLTAIRRTLEHELAMNPRVLVFGEDVGRKGGVHAATLGLQERFGEERVFDTSLSEEGIIGRAVGMALAGLVPVPEIQFRKYAEPAAEQLHDCGTMRWRTANRFAAPMVVRMPGGFFKCGDPWHSQCNEVEFLHSIGWQLAMPSNAEDAVGLLRTALRLNPDGGYLYFLLLGRAYLLDNDAEQALINLRQAAVRNPADLETHIYLAAALAMSGDEAGAAWEREEIRTLERGFSLRRWLDSYPLRSGEDRQKLQAMLGKAGFGSS